MSDPENTGLEPRPKRSPLDAEHRTLGAKMVPFGGWEMPLRYPVGTLAEHGFVRNSVGLFDVSHLGSVRVRGREAAAFLDRIFTNDLKKIDPGHAQYTLLLDESGGVVDDIIVWWIARGDFWVIPNASNTAAVASTLLEKSDQVGVSVEDRSEEMAILAVQGELWIDALEAAGLGELAPKRFAIVESGGILSAGTGYTGAPGCELMVGADDAPQIFHSLVAAVEKLGGGVCGLGARDTLRLEMGYPLHGQEMDATISPFEAGLGWVVAVDKPAFIGRESAIAAKEAPKRKLVGLEMTGREIPRSGYPVRQDSLGETGAVTSGNFSPVLQRGIALARVPIEGFGPGSQAEVEIRGNWSPATVTRPPFIRRGASSPAGSGQPGTTSSAAEKNS